MDGKLLSELGIVFVRTLLLYAVALIVFRGMGKRTVGKMGPFDIALIIIIGEAVALGMEAKNRLLPAILPIVLLGTVQWAMTHLNVKFPWLDRLSQGVPAILVKDGKRRVKTLRKERVSPQDLTMELRQSGVERLSDVKVAELEPTGKVAVLLKPSAKPLTAKDIPKVAQAVADLLRKQGNGPRP